MIRTIQFQGFRFKNSFNFKNAKAKSKYFEGLLIESVDKFREKQKQYFSERLHVVFTYMMLFKVWAYTDLIIAILFPGVRLAMAIVAITMFLIHLILNKKFKRDLFRFEFTIYMNESNEFLEFLREDAMSRNVKI
jgi:hypothetical protein